MDRGRDGVLLIHENKSRELEPELVKDSAEQHFQWDGRRLF